MASKTEKPAPNLHGNLIDENKWATYNCKFDHDFLDIGRNLKPLENIHREKIFSEIQSFQIPLELLEKDELVAYARILENCLHRCQQKFNQRDSDWQSSSHCRSDKAAKMPAVGSLRNPRFDVNAKAKKKITCKYFSAGFCKFANGCWYSHEGITKSLNGTSSRNSNGKTKNARVKKRITCKYFSAGFCKHGKYCWYSHHQMRRVQSAPENFHYKSSNKIQNGSLYSPGHLPCSTRNEAGAIDDTVAAEKEVQLHDVQPPIVQPQVVQPQNEDCVFEKSPVETEKHY